VQYEKKSFGGRDRCFCLELIKRVLADIWRGGESAVSLKKRVLAAGTGAFALSLSKEFWRMFGVEVKAL